MLADQLREWRGRDRSAGEGEEDEDFESALVKLEEAGATVRTIQNLAAIARGEIKNFEARVTGHLTSIKMTPVQQIAVLPLLLDAYFPLPGECSFIV